MEIKVDQLIEQDKIERKLPRLSFEINKDDLMIEFNEKMEALGLTSGSFEYEVLKQTYEKNNRACGGWVQKYWKLHKLNSGWGKP